MVSPVQKAVLNILSIICLLFLLASCSGKGSKVTPVISVKGDNPMVLTQGQVYSEKGAVAQDSAGVNYAVMTTGVAQIDTSVVGTYIITYTVQSGEEITSKTRTVKIIADTIAPVIKLNGDSELTLFLGDSYTDKGATATDNVDDSVSVTKTATVDTTKVGTYTLTYNAADAAGNKAKAITRTVIVKGKIIADTVAPVITLNGDSELTLFLGESYRDKGATATDNVDDSVSVTKTATVDTTKVGTYTLTYNAADTAGNKAKSITRTVIVKAKIISDTVAPIITLNGESELILFLGDSYTDKGATATDNVDDSVSVTKTATVDTTKVGTYTLTYNAADAAGNKAKAITRTVIVKAKIIADTVAPVITLNGDSELILFLGDSYTDKGATATDNVDDNVTVVQVGTVNTEKVGVYSVVYNAEDAAGNKAKDVTRLVTVKAKIIPDTIAPVITLNGDSELTLFLGDSYTDEGAAATDNVDDSVSIIKTGTVDTTAVGVYILTYRAEDTAGNTETVTRTVNVVRAIIQELKNILEDDLTPYTTEEEFSQTEYAKHHLSDDESQRLSRAHNLVATAEDPDIEWFTTQVDKPVSLVQAGDKYTVLLKKEQRDGTIIGAVDNDKLRLVVRVQRGKSDFEYVNNNDTSQYAVWKAPGELEINVPSDLDQGRLLIGVRPNFTDVGMTAIAERWSTVIVGEVWKIKSGVKTVDDSVVLFPVDNKATEGLSAESQFTLDEIGAKFNEQLTQNDTFMLPIVIKDTSLQVGDLVSYMVLDGKPYSGKVFSVETRGEQQLALMTPEFFEVYGITDADEQFMVKEGLYPEHVVFREGETASTDIDENDPTVFQRRSQKPSGSIKFFDEVCESGKSTLTFSPVYSFSPVDVGVTTTISAVTGDTKCTWKATPNKINLDRFFIASGPLAIITKILGVSAKLGSIGKVEIAVNQAPGFGIKAGYSLVKGGTFETLSVGKNLAGLGSRNLNSLSSSVNASIEASVGMKFSLEVLSQDSLFYSILGSFGDLTGIGIESEALITEGLAAKIKNATEVYNTKKSSSLAFNLSAKVGVKANDKAKKLLSFLSLPKGALSITPIEKALIPDSKASADHSFNEVRDNGQGAASLTDLKLTSSFLKTLLPSSAGVLSHADKESSVFNDRTESISYEVDECKKDPNHKITTPAIACSGWMCGKVTKSVKLCKGLITISSVIADARINRIASGKATVTNNAGDSTIKFTGSPLKPEVSSIKMLDEASTQVTFSKKCPASPGVYRSPGFTGLATAQVVGTEVKAESENIMVCHDDDFRGDPHIVTADGLGYDYYASGDYVLSRVEGVDEYEIQARFLPGYQTSWPQAVSLKVGGDVIEVQGRRASGLNQLSIWINGEESNLGVASSEGKSVKIITLPSGGILAVTKTASNTSNNGFPTALTVVWPKESQAEAYGVILNVDTSNDPFIRIQIARPDTFSGKERGLMGNNNGDATDDFIRRNGEVLGQDHALSFTELYALFGTDWLVRPYESLFRNPEAIKPEFPETVITLTPEQRALGEKACLALTGFYREACIIDVGLTGSVDIVKENYASTDDLNELSEEIVTPRVDAPRYSLQVGEQVLAPDSGYSMHYQRTLTIKHEAGEGNFILLIRPPRGAAAILETGMESHTASGDFSTEISVDCTSLNTGTDLELLPELGAVQLWLQDPLSGTAVEKVSEVELPCFDESMKPLYSMQLEEEVLAQNSGYLRHYKQQVSVKLESGKGDFLLLLKAPEGSIASFDSGELRYVASGDSSPEIEVDCTAINQETDSELLKTPGKVELWSLLHGEAVEMTGELELIGCLDESKHPEYSMDIGNRVELDGSTDDKQHYQRVISVNHDTDDNGEFVLSVIPPEGSIATLDGTEQSVSMTGNFEATLELDCSQSVIENGQTGMLELRSKHPFVNEESKLHQQLILICHKGRLNGTGQDTDYGGPNKMSFTRISNGNCVKDNNTGLVWESKADKNGQQGDSLHDVDDRYAWYQPDYAVNGGAVGNEGASISGCYGYLEGQPGSYCNTKAYIQRVNEAGWCGYNDWRLPTIRESTSMLDFSRAKGRALWSTRWVDTDYFLFHEVEFWSSTTWSSNRYRAWSAGGIYGPIWGLSKKSSALRVRLVRGGK